MTFDVKLDVEPMTLSADMGQVTEVKSGEVTKESVIAALGYTPANQETEDNRPSNRIMSEDGGNAINLSKGEGISLVDKLATIDKRGVYTLYVSKGCPDNPPHAAEINSSLRGICHITLTGPENGYMYAWILLFDKEGNMYTRYTSDTASTWIRYAIASDQTSKEQT